MRFRLDRALPRTVGQGVLFPAAVVGAILGAPDRGAAQTAQVSGTVLTASGEALPDVVVELAGPAAAQVRRAGTTPGGRFEFRSLLPGAYALTARLPGFQPATASLAVDTAGTYTVALTLETAVLDDIVVTATRGQQALGNVPAAVSIITKDEIQQARVTTHLEESLRRVPGVRVEDELGGSSRTRIIIRGAGTRANSPAGSGVRGVRVFVDGIPKNNGGGSAQDLINIDLGSAQRIEVLRGPSSALYGNQSGGVVNVITEEGPPGGVVSFRQTVGSYGLFREHLKLGGETGGGLNYFASVFRTDQDGYRAQSRFNSTGFHGKVRLSVDQRSDLMLIASFDRLFQQSPGPLTEAKFLQNPRQADSIFAANNVRSTVEEFRLGAVYRRELFGDDVLELTGYYIPRHLGPFQQIGVRIPQDFTNRGGGVRYQNGGSLGSFSNRFTMGIDFQNTPITTGTFNSTNGAALAELEENSTIFGIYLLDEFSLRPNIQLSVGGRYDHIRFTSENLARATPVAERTFQKLTPKVGITWQPVGDLSVYGAYGRAFEAPVIGELRVLPGGAFGFNSSLEPQVSDNFEVGLRGAPFERLGFELAVFKQDVHNFISPFGTFPNNSFQNVGEVAEFGIEVAADLRLIAGLGLGVAYTFSDFTFDQFNNGVDDFSGNRLPGVPRHLFHGEIRYRDARGLFGAVEVQSASRVFVNDPNTATTPSYTVAHARAGYEWQSGRGFRLAPFIGVNNLTNKAYSAFALINDAGQRYYNPLPELSAYGGIGITF